MTSAGHDSVRPAESGGRFVVSPHRPDVRDAVDARHTTRFPEMGARA